MTVSESYSLMCLISLTLVAYIAGEAPGGQSKRLKRSHNTAVRNEQAIIQPQAGITADSSHLSLRHIRHGSRTQSGAVYPTETASVYNHSRQRNRQFAGSRGFNSFLSEEISDHTWSEATESLDERDPDENPENTENLAENGRQPRNVVIWELEHQGCTTSTEDMTFPVPDSQELIAPLDPSHAIDVMAPAFPSADTHLVSGANMMELLATGSDADFLDTAFQMESTSFCVYS